MENDRIDSRQQGSELFPIKKNLENLFGYSRPRNLRF
jgi:hypothetical protein